MISFIFAILISYLLGSIPSGLWIGLWVKGIDVRKHGSKNIGATNVFRVLGAKLGGIVLVVDMLKGVIPTLIFAKITDWNMAPLFCGLSAVIGHTASVFVNFRGGKGVATSTGVFLTLCPIPTIICAFVFATSVYLTRMVSVGSCLAAITMIVLVFILPPDWMTYPTHLLPEIRTLQVVVFIVAVLILVRHKSNIQRIIRGEENKI